MLTIDASVWLNADSPSEPNHPASRALLDHVAAAQIQVVVPTLLLVEVAGAISRTRHDPDLGRDYARSMSLLSFIRWVPLDDRLADVSWELAARHTLRGADAVYAAVATEHHCDLVSLDGEHLTRLPAVLNTMTPVDALSRLKQA